MRGYYTNFGYLGYVSGHWMLFVSEEEYVEYMRLHGLTV